MKANINPKVTLIGAGPGDPDLITVKGVKALKKADLKYRLSSSCRNDHWCYRGCSDG